MGEVAYLRERAEGEPCVTLASESPHDLWTRKRFDRWVGPIVVAKSVARPEADSCDQTMTLAESINRTVSEGSAEAEHLVDINVGFAASEACFKDEHVTEIKSETNEQGEIMQFGLTQQQMHHNSIALRPARHPTLEAITLAEALNGHRIEDAHRAGRLKDCWFVVPSLVPEDVPEKDLGLDGDGYFLEDLTYVLQGTTEESDKVITQSGFCKGVEAPAGASFEERMSMRFDIKALGRLYSRFGLPVPRTAQEFIENPIEVPKSMMPNGMVDVMRWVDEEADVVLGRRVERTEAQYIALYKESQLREASLAETKAKIKRALLARAGTFTDPMDAIGLLWSLTREHAFEDALNNDYIDARVFGSAGAHELEMARYYMTMGDLQLAQSHMHRGAEVAVVSGCGGGARKKNSEEQGNSSTKNEDGQSETAEEGSSGECDIITENCYCCGYNDDGTPRRSRLKVAARYDKEGTLRCLRSGCGAYITKGGKDKEIGQIAKKAQQLATKSVA